MSSLAAFSRVMRVLQTYANVPASEVRALAQELDDLPGAGGSSATVEAFSVPIDYANPASVALPAGSVLASSADVTRLLNGAPAFKYIKDCWDALPDLAHDVTFNLAAGVHRPRAAVGDSTFTAFSLEGKRTRGGSFIMQGAAPSTWTTVTGPLTVASITGGTDPSLVFSGTPFTGLNLRGLHVVLSTGQICVIHDHDNSSLKVTDVLSPSPVGGTARVARPSTILRNSLNDSTPFASSALMDFNIDGFTTSFFGHRFNDLRVDTFSPSSAGWGWSLGFSIGMVVSLLRCLNDYAEQQASFGRFQDGRTIQLGGYAQFVLMEMCGLRCNNAGGGVNEFVYSNVALGGFQLIDCVAYNPRLGSASLVLGGVGSIGFLWRTIIDWLSPTSAGCVDAEEGELFAFDFGSGVVPEIRSAAIGLWMRNRAFIVGDHGLRFKGCTTGPVKVENGAVVDLRNSSAGHGLRDGGGNSGVGIDIVGTHCAVRLASGTNVTGATGDTRTAEGTVRSYATVLASGPFTDNALDYLQKVS